MYDFPGLRICCDHKTKVLDQVGTYNRHNNANEIGPEHRHIFKKDDVPEGGIQTETPPLQYISKGQPEENSRNNTNETTLHHKLPSSLQAHQMVSPDFLLLWQSLQVYAFFFQHLWWRNRK